MIYIPISRCCDQVQVRSQHGSNTFSQQLSRCPWSLWFFLIHLGVRRYEIFIFGPRSCNLSIRRRLASVQQLTINSDMAAPISPAKTSRLGEDPGAGV